MKKFLSGVLFGVAIATTSSLFADELQSLVGKQVQKETIVLVNGQPLEDKAVIIDGKSYGPIRAIGEAVGQEVGFIDGNVTLTSSGEQEEITMPDTTQEIPVPIQDPETEMTKEQVQYRIGFLQEEIKRLERDLVFVNAALKEYEEVDNEEFAEIQRNTIDEISQLIAEYQTEIAQLEAQLAQ